jgi:hypothetical protein
MNFRRSEIAVEVTGKLAFLQHQIPRKVCDLSGQNGSQAGLFSAVPVATCMPLGPSQKHHRRPVHTLAFPSLSFPQTDLSGPFPMGGVKSRGSQIGIEDFFGFCFFLRVFCESFFYKLGHFCLQIPRR